MSLRNFKSLSARHRAIVAVAVLLDGREAISYLETSGEDGPALRAAAADISQMAPEVRMPLVGTLLRMALKELGR